LTGYFNDAGGKFDADKDQNHIQTVFREVKEEMGIQLIFNGFEPYVDLCNHGITYRCYIAFHNPESPAFVSLPSMPEHPVTRMPLKHFVELTERPGKNMIQHRLKFLLDRKMQNCPFDVTLRQFLKNLNYQTQRNEIKK
jgi:8-oxo-dGTP pyrophosphatase MutT (NUDIX family)